MLRGQRATGLAAFKACVILRPRTVTRSTYARPLRTETVSDYYVWVLSYEDAFMAYHETRATGRMPADVDSGQTRDRDQNAVGRISPRLAITLWLAAAAIAWWSLGHAVMAIM